MKNLKYFIPSGIVLALLIGAATAFANPSLFAPQAKTTTATTTPTFMTPGTATTTLVYDSWGVNGTNQTNTSGGRVQTTFAADSAELLVQFTASSTSAKLNIKLEYSDDGIDWYQDTNTNLRGYATTTIPLDIATVPFMSWLYASSTPGGGAVATTNNLDMHAISIPTPLRYERAIISCATGGTNCTVWAQIVPKRQTP